MEKNTVLPNENDTEKSICELDERSFVRYVAKRPGIFVGAVRLDYVQHFISGFSFGNEKFENGEYFWLLAYEMEYWLMQNQSISIRHAASITGWELFFACFGVRAKAMQQFSAFLHSQVPPPGVEGPRSGVTASKIFAKYAKWHYDEKRPIQECQKTVIDCIEDMVSNAEIEYDELLIYVRRKRLFAQVRFVMHTLNGWVEDTAILGRPENYGKLINLHAYIDCLDDEQLKRLTDHNLHKKRYASVFIDEETENDAFSFGDQEVRDEESFYHHFEEWKLNVTARY